MVEAAGDGPTAVMEFLFIIFKWTPCASLAAWMNQITLHFASALNLSKMPQEKILMSAVRFYFCFCFLIIYY